MSKNSDILNPDKILRENLHLKAGDQLADLGCGGAGHFVIPAAKIVDETGEVHAVDILRPALGAVASRAKLEGLNNIKIYWSDLEKYGALNLHDNSLDCVLLVNILFESQNTDAVLKEATRLVKAGGKLLVIDWQAGRFPIGPKPESKVPAQVVTTAAAKLGLQKIEEFAASDYHYGLIFSK
jgi:ubiquinone/menaquinone biosynthesis C-methylase UbiE